MKDRNQSEQRPTPIDDPAESRRHAGEGESLDSEKKFRSIVESSPMGMHMYRLETDGTLVFIGANPAADRLLGVDNSVFVGKTIEEAFPPLAETEVPERYRRAARWGESWQAEQIEYEDEQIKGAFEVHAFQTSPNNMVALFLEITGRKRMEAALKESEEKYRHLVENINDVIFALNRDGVFTYISPTIETLTGLTPSEVIGRPFGDFVHPEDLPVLRRIFDERMSGHGAPAEYRIVTRSGEPSWVRSSSRPLLTEDGVAGLQGVLVDITEAKRAEKERQRLETELRQAQKMEAIGRLAGGVAHDFNNLLSPILGYAELLLMELHPGDPRYEIVQEMHRAGSRAKDLTRQLLAFGRKQVLAMKPLDLNRVISGFEKMLRRTIREDIRITLTLQDSIGCIEGDISMLEQIFMNLVVNAQDAMPKGGSMSIETDEIVVDNATSRVRPHIQPGRYVKLAVSDTGTGIDAAHIEHVFEPFFTTKEEGKGTGLGLATVYGIVQQHKAAISVASSTGSGTTFTIFFPRVEGPAERVDETITVPPVEGGSETIMVVEDDEMVRTLCSTILKERGYRVIVAGDPRECLSLVERTGTVDLLVTDVVMPALNGRELYRRLSKTLPNMKVLFMSGYTDGMGTEPDAEAGNFIHKPFSVQALTRKIRELLDG